MWVLALAQLLKCQGRDSKAASGDQKPKAQDVGPWAGMLAHAYIRIFLQIYRCTYAYMYACVHIVYIYNGCKAGLMGPEWRTKYIVAATASFSEKRFLWTTGRVALVLKHLVTCMQHRCVWHRKCYYGIHHSHNIISLYSSEPWQICREHPSHSDLSAFLLPSRLSTWELCCQALRLLQVLHRSSPGYLVSKLHVKQDPKRRQWSQLRMLRLHHC